MMTLARYKECELMMTSLIIMKIRFDCFQEDKVDRSCIRLHAGSYARLYNHRFHDHDIIAFLSLGLIYHHYNFFSSFYQIRYNVSIISTSCLWNKSLIRLNELLQTKPNC